MDDCACEQVALLYTLMSLFMALFGFTMGTCFGSWQERQHNE